MTTPPEPAAPTPAAPPPADAGLDQRVTSIEGKLDQVLGFLSSTPDAPADPVVERPEVSISEEIRRQLDERDALAPKEPAAPKPAELTETTPEKMVRRVERMMGWAE